MIKKSTSKYAIIILAAGQSSRLGRPKQLVKIDNQYLLQNTIDAASSIDNADIHIVLGAYSEEIQGSIDISYPIYINPDWKGGMGKSISYGISKIIDCGYEAVILSVCDQPYLEAIHLEQLIDIYESDEKIEIVISKYKNGSGPPSLFSRQYFDQLSHLEGDEGGKPIIKNNQSKVKSVPFDQGNIDIDTSDDILLIW